MSLWIVIPSAWAAMALLMAVLWVVQRRTGDAAIVDIAWALGVGINSALFAFVATGDPLRRVVVAVLAMLWALRLAGHVLIRVLTMPEDGRYAVLRDRWGTRHQRLLFGFFQLQASWAVLFALPMLLAMSNPQPFPQSFDVVGLIVFVLAAGGETIADRQLQRFRNDRANSGRVCRAGLWRYSRHPNYFFEWCHWWSYVAFCWGTSLIWPALLAPFAILFFLLKMTGIPPTEAQALASRGEAYREYQRTTSVFIPWPPKSAKT